MKGQGMRRSFKDPVTGDSFEVNVPVEYGIIESNSTEELRNRFFELQGELEDCRSRLLQARIDCWNKFVEDTGWIG